MMATVRGERYRRRYPPGRDGAKEVLVIRPYRRYETLRRVSVARGREPMMGDVIAARIDTPHVEWIMSRDYFGVNYQRIT